MPASRARRIRTSCRTFTKKRGRSSNMISSMRKRSSLFVAGAAIAVAVAAVRGQTPAASGQQLAGQVFKNVQVLKDVPVDDFLTVMGLMTAAVGSDCAGCHEAAGTTKVDWAADTPAKRTARRMSAMVLAINKDNFGGR